MEAPTMEKITDTTAFDYYFSEQAYKARGGRIIQGKLYVERIRSGKTPVLSKTYNDLVLVHSGISINLNSEAI